MTTPDSENEQPATLDHDQPICPLLNSSAYLSYLGATGQRTAQDVHMARVHHPSAGTITAYVKFYPNGHGSARGLLNEILAYILGKTLGVPLPERAVVLLVPLEKVSQPPQWMKRLLKSDKHAEYPAFCTEAIPGAPTTISLSTADDAMISEDLRAWKSLPDATRFDQHIANCDRHVNNLVRVRKGEYRLIDHGRLIAENGDWRREDLLSDVHVRDRLLKWAYPDRRPDEALSAILGELPLHEWAVQKALPEISQWCDLLCTPTDTQALLKYLTERGSKLADIFRREYKFLI